MAKRTKSCSEVLIAYFKANPHKWVKKVEFYVIAEDWSPETVGRELRTLAEDKFSGVMVDYYNGKYASGLAMYSYGQPVKVTPSVVIKDGVAYVI